MTMNRRSFLRNSSIGVVAVSTGLAAFTEKRHGLAAVVSDLPKFTEQKHLIAAVVEGRIVSVNVLVRRADGVVLGWTARHFENQRKFIPAKLDQALGCERTYRYPTLRECQQEWVGELSARKHDWTEIMALKRALEVEERRLRKIREYWSKPFGVRIL